MKQTNFKIKPEIFDLYTDAGLILFPCNKFTKKLGKKGYDKATYDPLLMVKNHNYAVVLKDKYIILEVDPRNYKTSDDRPLSRLCEDAQS